MTERFLVTGAAGCLGAWTIARLVHQSVDVVAFDTSDDRRRLRLLLDDSTVENVEWVLGDLRDFEQLAQVVERRQVTHVVHLAALQVPFCRADPVLGSQVNVTGTVNVFEATRRSDGRIKGLVYASSIAVFGPAREYPDGIASDDSPQHPSSLYGVYKQANEATARIYFEDWGVSSIGLRPSIVYGPGRDQGLTSGPTVAMLRAAAGLDSHIGLGGSSTFHHAADVAGALISAARAEYTGAAVHNVGGTDATVAQIATMIEHAARGVTVTHDSVPLAFPRAIDGSGLAALVGDSVHFRLLDLGVADTISSFRRLLHDGLVTVTEQQ